MEENINTIQNLKESILKEYDRLSENDTFQFECGPHLECFNDCCADVNIFLTPYDVMRMRRSVNMGSTEFLSKYTIIPFDENQKLPVPLMMMQETERKQCHFVDDEKGCTIYKDRPWPCRMYPVGSASPAGQDGFGKEGFFFIMKEDHCKGHERKKQWTIKEWMEDQQVGEYEEFGELFKRVTLHDQMSSDWKPKPKQVELYWMCLYDTDKFKRFVLESSFLDRFEISQAEAELLKTSDEALLRMGFKYVLMALYGEKTIAIRDENQEKQKLAAAQK